MSASARPVLARLIAALVFVVMIMVVLVPPAAAQREAPEPQRAFAEGLALFESRLYDPAAVAFADFRRRFPSDPHAAEALHYQARAALALGRDDEAIRLFEQLHTQYPADPRATEAQLSLGQYFVQNENYARARQTLRRAYERNPQGPQAPLLLFRLGQATQKDGAAAEAAAHFRRVADDYPSSAVAPDALYALAATQVEREQYRAAAQSLERLADVYPESPYARTLGLALAEVYYELEDYERTIQEVERRLEDLRGEERTRAEFLRADAYNQMGDAANAIRFYRAFADAYPDSRYAGPARYGLAMNLFQQEDYAEAAPLFAEMPAGADADLARKAAYYAAVSYDRASQPDAAIAAYQQYADRYSESAQASAALFALGTLQYDAERWPAAAQTFARLLDAYENAEQRGEAQALRGHALVALGRYDEALDSYGRVSEEAGRVPPAVREAVQYQQAWARYQSGEYARAADAFADFRDAYPQSERAADALFWQAESRFQTDALEQAQAAFQDYLRTYRSGGRVNAAHYAVGWTYFKLGEYDAASQAFQRFLNGYDAANAPDAAGTADAPPYRQDALLRLGDSYYALKRYDEAEQTYARVAGANKDYALYQTAQAAYFAGDLDRAAQALRQLLSDYPQSDLRQEGRYRLGLIRFQQQDYDAAIAAYRRVAQAAPGGALAARAQYGIGDALFNDGRYRAAVEAYREVLSRYPDSPSASDAASGIQYALQAMGEGDTAVALADSLEADNPGAGLGDELRFRQAEAKYRSGDIDAALQDFLRFVRSSQNTRLLPEAYFYLGSIYADREQTREATNYLRQVVDTYPDSPRRVDAASRLGQLYQEQDRSEDALRVYRAMAEMRPDDAGVQAEARFGQSMALMALGRTDDAETLLDDTIAAAPNAPEATLARLGLGRIYEETGRADDAAELYRAVVRQSQSEAGAEALYRLGAVRLEQGDARAAIEQLTRLPDLYSGYPEWLARGYLAQARAFRALGQRGDAVRLYDRVMNEFAGTAFAQTAAEEKEALL